MWVLYDIPCTNSRQQIKIHHTLVRLRRKSGFTRYSYWPVFDGHLNATKGRCAAGAPYIHRAH